MLECKKVCETLTTQQYNEMNLLLQHLPLQYNLTIHPLLDKTFRNRHIEVAMQHRHNQVFVS